MDIGRTRVKEKTEGQSICDDVIELSNTDICDYDSAEEENTTSNLDNRTKEDCTTIIMNNSTKEEDTKTDLNVEEEEDITNQSNSTDGEDITNQANSTEEEVTKTNPNNSTEKEGPKTNLNNSSNDPTSNLNNSSGEGLTENLNDSSEEGSMRNLNDSSEEGPTTNLNNNSEEGPTANLNNNSEEGPTANLNDSSGEDPTANLNNNSGEGPTANLNNSSGEDPTTNLNNNSGEGLTTNLNNNSEEGPTENINGSSGEGPTENRNNNSEEDPTTNLNNSSLEGPTTNLNDSSEEGPTANLNNNSGESPTTNLNDSSEEGPTTNLNDNSEEGPTTNLNDSSEEGPTENLNNSSGEDPTTNLNNNSGEGPTENINGSSGEGPTANLNDSSGEGPTENRNNNSEEGPTANPNNNSGEGPTTNLNDSSGEGPTTNLNNSSGEGPTANPNNNSGEGPTTNLNDSSNDPTSNLNDISKEGSTANLNNSSEEGPTTNLNGSSGEGPTANLNDISGEGPTSNLNNNSNDPTANLNNSSEEGPTTNLNDISKEGPTANLNDSSGEGPTTNLNDISKEGSTENLNVSSEDPTANLNVSSDEDQTTNLNNSSKKEDTRTNLNSTEEEGEYLANSAEDEGKTIIAERPSDTNDTTTKTPIVQKGEQKIKEQAPLCSTCRDQDVECQPSDSPDDTELGGNLWEDGGIFATDVGIAKQYYSLYHTNGSTLNQKVQTNFIGTPMSRRVPMPTSLKPKAAKDSTTKEIGSTLNSQNLSSHLKLLSASYSRHDLTTNEKPKLKKSSAIRTQQCKGTLFAICTHCNHRNIALYSCEDCLVNCCSVCIYALHPRQTLYKNHAILTGHTVLRCEVHNEPLSWYCRTCDHPICAMSLAQSSHASHDVEKVETYIKNEKKQLLESYRQVGTRCLEKAHVNLTALDECEESVKLEWIMKKQQIQQEFATLRTVIGETEDYLIKDGQKAVYSRMRHIKSMRHAYGNVVDREARIAQMSLDSVTETTKSHFLKLVNNTQEELSNFKHQTEAIPTIRLTGMTPLSTPLSLFQVTTYLKQLRLSLGSSAIRPHQRVVFVPSTAIRASITTHQLWDTPDLASSSLTYLIEIKEGWSRKGFLWKGIVSPGGVVFNAPGVRFLQGHCRYLMKVTPRYRTTTGYVTYETTLGKPCHIFIITEVEAMDQSPDRMMRTQIAASFLYESFEEARLACITRLARAEKERVNYQRPATDLYFIKPDRPGTSHTFESHIWTTK